MKVAGVRLLDLLTVAAVFGADRASKLLITRLLEPGEVVPITSFFNLVLVYNPGVSFGLLSGLGSAAPWALTLLTVAITVLLVVWAYREGRPLARLALWTIVGGALGNIYDRLRFGAVVDYLDFHIGTWHWPAFNLADVAVVGGVLWLLGETLFERRRGEGSAER